MLKSKKILEKWAKEILRCEEILNCDTSTNLEIEQSQWKIESIVNLYSVDADAIFTLMMLVEKLSLQKDLTD